MNKQDYANLVIELAGGPFALGRQLEYENLKAVSNWRQVGIPLRYCLRCAQLYSKQIAPDYADYAESIVIAIAITKLIYGD